MSVGNIRAGRRAGGTDPRFYVRARERFFTNYAYETRNIFAFPRVDSLRIFSSAGIHASLINMYLTYACEAIFFANWEAMHNNLSFSRKATKERVLLFRIFNFPCKEFYIPCYFISILLQAFSFPYLFCSGRFLVQDETGF